MTDGARWFVFPVNPEPWAVGEAYPVRRGGRMAAAIGPNLQLKAYQEAIREQLGTEEGNLWWPKGTQLQLTCYFWRQRAAYTTHQGRTARKHEIDATNALKAIEDAFQKYLYHNDKDNRRVTSTMVSQDVDITHPVIVVKVEPYIGFDPNEIPKEIWELVDRATRTEV
jgi:hypothetical protein